MFRLFKSKVERDMEKATERDLFFYNLRSKTLKLDPLLTYNKLKEIGFDTFGRRLSGVLKGEAHHTAEFMIAMHKVFGIVDYETDEREGFTVLEAADLYIKFFLFVRTLKKNYTLLADFAPSMEQEWSVLRNARSESSSDLAQSADLSVSQNVSKPPQQSQDSAPTTEQAEPSTD